ncbi:MAG: ABC transporter ATP-binding protein [Ignavibacteria bacterium]
MIKITGLEKRYGKTKALQDISLELIDGSIYSIMGPNGSGKTTLLKSILGLVLADKGIIEVNGINTRTSHNYRHHIGYMPQTASFPQNLQVREVIEIIKKIRATNRTLDLELYERFNIPNFENKKINSLSQGTLQRLSGALTFLFDTDIIILDEPTAGLDPYSAEFMKQKIKTELAKGKLIIFTTHILNEVQELADSLVFLYEGKVKYFGTVPKTSNNGAFKEMVYSLFQNNE